MNTEIQKTVENKPVFDPEFHTELIIKHLYFSCILGIKLPPSVPLQVTLLTKSGLHLSYLQRLA